MSALWTSEEAVAATGGATSGPWEARGVSIDSRTIEDGDLFVAIVGESDGHAYVGDAFEKGASAAMVSRTEVDGAAERPLLEVPDTLKGLEALGIAARARSEAKIVAVTGSVGKTGTKEGLRLAFGALGPTHASAASYNNYLGVPLTLARMPKETRFGIIEIGMNHAGEITPLAKMARPHVAIITTVEPVHIEFFDSVEGIADAKAEIFQGLDEHGTAVLNRDNPHYARLERAASKRGARIISFGIHKDADIRLLETDLGEDESTARVTIFGAELSYRLGAPGRHVVMNSLSILGALHALDVNVGKGARALAKLGAPKGRGERSRRTIPAGEIHLIDESYNANPASMLAAFDNLSRARPARGGRRIAVLGDMLELGARSAEFHKALAPAVEAARIDLVFACGPLMKALFDALAPSRQGGYALDAAALAPKVVTALSDGDVVMVKGSLGSNMAAILAALASKEEEGSDAA